MNCPGCRTQVAKDAAICPHCDFIIDASFLSPSGPGAPVASAAPASAARAAAAPSDADTVTDPAELLARARAFVRERTRADRLTLGGLGLLLLSCFMPWQETAQDGEVLGLLGLGAPAFAAALLAMAALYVRVRAALPWLPAHAAWLAQAGGALAGAFGCVVALRLASDGSSLPSAVGSYDVVLSAPTFGLFLGLAGMLAALAGTVLALRDPAPLSEGAGG